MPKCPHCGKTFRLIDAKKVKVVKHRHLNHVLLTDDEFNKLEVKFGKGGAWDRIRNLDEAIAIHGYKYKCHKTVILKWARSEPVAFNQSTHNEVPMPRPERRKDTSEEARLLIEMKCIQNSIDWKNKPIMKLKVAKIKELQLKYNKLREMPLKIGDIINDNKKV